MKTMQKNWDVIIVGAGPAGLALARGLRLAEPTRTVLVLDRAAQIPTQARIGESLPGAARVLLKQLQLWQTFAQGPHRERGATLSCWDTPHAVWQDHLMDPNGSGWHIDRRAFEQMLLAGAVSEGANIQWACRPISASRDTSHWHISIEQAGQIEHYQAPWLIDATGRNSSIAKFCSVAKSRHDDLVCAHAFLQPTTTIKSPPLDSTTRLAADENGWWYTVPLPNGHRALAFHTDASDPQRTSLKSPEYFLKSAHKHQVLADVLAGYTAHNIHFCTAGTRLLDIETLQKQCGLLAIGDALIAFDPISSQGLFHALASAHCAARAISARLSSTSGATQNFFNEMQAVSQRYMTHWHQTYAGPRRFAECNFWKKRLTLIDEPSSHQTVATT